MVVRVAGVTRKDFTFTFIIIIITKRTPAANNNKKHQEAGSIKHI
jgi:hypothetical protein